MCLACQCGASIFHRATEHDLAPLSLIFEDMAQKKLLLLLLLLYNYRYEVYVLIKKEYIRFSLDEGTICY